MQEDHLFSYPLYKELWEHNLINEEGFLTAEIDDLARYKAFLQEKSSIATSEKYKKRKNILDEVQDLLKNEFRTRQQNEYLLSLLEKLGLCFDEDSYLVLKSEDLPSKKYVGVREPSLSVWEREIIEERRRIKVLHYDIKILDEWLDRVCSSTQQIQKPKYSSTMDWKYLERKCRDRTKKRLKEMEIKRRNKINNFHADNDYTWKKAAGWNVPPKRPLEKIKFKKRLFPATPIGLDEVADSTPSKINNTTLKRNSSKFDEFYRPDKVIDETDREQPETDKVKEDFGSVLTKNPDVIPGCHFREAPSGASEKVVSFATNGEKLKQKSTLTDQEKTFYSKKLDNLEPISKLISDKEAEDRDSNIILKDIDKDSLPINKKHVDISPADKAEDLAVKQLGKTVDVTKTKDISFHKGIPYLLQKGTDKKWQLAINKDDGLISNRIQKGILERLEETMEKLKNRSSAVNKKPLKKGPKPKEFLKTSRCNRDYGQVNGALLTMDSKFENHDLDRHLKRKSLKPELMEVYEDKEELQKTCERGIYCPCYLFTNKRFQNDRSSVESLNNSVRAISDSIQTLGKFKKDEQHFNEKLEENVEKDKTRINKETGVREHKIIAKEDNGDITNRNARRQHKSGRIGDITIKAIDSSQNENNQAVEKLGEKNSVAKDIQSKNTNGLKHSATVKERFDPDQLVE